MPYSETQAPSAGGSAMPQDLGVTWTQEEWQSYIMAFMALKTLAFRGSFFPTKEYILYCMTQYKILCMTVFSLI